MMYVPLNAAIVVEVYRTSKKDQSDIPRTTTQLYSCLVRSLLRRYLNDHPVRGKQWWNIFTLLRRYFYDRLYGKQEWKIRTFEDLPPDVYKQFCELGRIAYEGIANGQQVIYDDLPEDFETLGLMQCVPELYVDKGAAVSHSFLHLTVHEFMAAFHLSQQPVEAEQFMSEASSQKRVLRFLAGLTRRPGVIPVVVKMEEEFKRFIDIFMNRSVERFKSIKTLAYCEELESYRTKLDLENLYLLFEVQGGGKTVKTSPTAFYTDSDMSALDCYVLGCCISHSDCTWALWYESGGDELEGLVQGALEHPLQPQGTISALYLNGITSEGVKHLLKLPKHMLASSLKTLDLSGTSIGNGGSVPLIRMLSALNHLSLNNTGIGVEDCRALSELLSSSSGLKALHITGNDLPPEAVELIASGLQENTRLEELWIGEAQFSQDNCVSLASVLWTNSTLNALYMKKCGIGPEGAGHLAGALWENTTLEVLYLSRNPIGVAGATALAEALIINKSLKLLNTRDDSIGAEGIQKLLNSLTQNTTLEHLWLLKSSKDEDIISSEAYNILRDTNRIEWYDSGYRFRGGARKSNTEEQCSIVDRSI